MTARPVILFTDYGERGPYVGQLKAALLAHGHHGPILDLMADAPVFDPRASSYLLAALLPQMPADAVMLCVVDPGVGGDRLPLVTEVDARLLVGPDNGLFELAGRQARHRQAWRIDWRPPVLSATFHGRDLFAPVAAALAAGRRPEVLPGTPMDWPGRPDWPDELAAVVYIDGFGNVMTGLSARNLPVDAVLSVNGRHLTRAATFGDRSVGEPFWYANSIGLVELAVNGGCADVILGLTPGEPVAVVSR